MLSTFLLALTLRLIFSIKPCVADGQSSQPTFKTKRDVHVYDFRLAAAEHPVFQTSRENSFSRLRDVYANES